MSKEWRWNYYISDAFVVSKAQWTGCVSKGPMVIAHGTMTGALRVLKAAISKEPAAQQTGLYSCGR